MNKSAGPPRNPEQNWRHMVEAAIFETNADNLSQRIREAQDAIMDEIEDSFDTASQSERQSMINAMNSLRQLRRLIQTPGFELGSNVGSFTDA
ncbi:MAG TPA: hypothetical protein VNY32_01755 [Candidatus Acidoferrales bacterium]|nr:hypothetical protein [Candidatus Acidoferrales bacterium]